MNGSKKKKEKKIQPLCGKPYQVVFYWNRTFSGMANWNARWSANECNDTLSRDPQKVYKKQGPKQQQQQRELDLWGIEDAHHLQHLDGERPVLRSPQSTANRMNGFLPCFDTISTGIGTILAFLEFPLLFLFDFVTPGDTYSFLTYNWNSSGVIIPKYLQ